MTPKNNQFTGNLPTISRAGSEHFGQQIEIASASNLAEFSRLPKVKERCPISGASRSWLIETNAKLPGKDQFLVRVRRSGCLRSVVFVSVPKLTAFLRGVQEGVVPGFTTEGNDDAH